MNDDPGAAEFIRISNKDIWQELQDLKVKVQALNIKVYGVIAGLVAGIGIQIWGGA